MIWAEMVLLILIKTLAIIISQTTANEMQAIKVILIRNDGVDIYKDSSHYETYYVGNIEDSEWMQYTINVTAQGSYALKLVTGSDNDNGIISVIIDDKMLAAQTPITSTGGMKDWQTQTIKTISLNKGKHVIKAYADKGGFNFKQLVFIKQ